MTRKGRRLAIISAAGVTLTIAIGLILFALRDSIVFFYGPSELAAKAPPPGTRLRIGGLVKRGSLTHEGSSTVIFAVTDLKHDVDVSYTGLLPDLFREGQGVVAEGTVEGPSLFHADTVLAKHDERYMPKEVADELKREGTWRNERSARAQ
ncbi:cytochrome c maturation protein CcmE [Bradyrhizobium sp. CB82]|uniref:cytochrome c maturation protein CcmE n=1 Tax=unclassified Bradyrhizobium TaxID=2631580 RepID=UPI001150D068|nr:MULTISPECIES: cytochrome c maturation protein CcmE [unclassified Bradyrhizobium]TQF29709.1 cytochrome C biogenesis protein CcdA [Bradyrhizobium sp. UNPA324]WFU42779.1 cytochrome c maturation protein CcmE [Bradyrhizobium sp. CB82]